MATHRNILDNCRQMLGDPDDGLNQVRWQTDELLRHYNKALRDIAKKVDLYRRADVAGYFNERGILQLPPDVLNVLEVYWDGAPLRYLSRFEVRDRDPRYLSTTGTPEAWYRGLSDPKEIRLWPVPPADDSFKTEVATWEDNDEYGVIASIELDGVFIDIDDDEGVLAALTVDDEEALLSQDDESDLGDPAYMVFNGLVRVSVSYLPDWVQYADLDKIRPDREDIEETLEYGVLYRALEKSGREEDIQRSRHYRSMFFQRLEEHAADRSSDFTEIDHTVEARYI